MGVWEGRRKAGAGQVCGQTGPAWWWFQDLAHCPDTKPSGQPASCWAAWSFSPILPRPVEAICCSKFWSDALLGRNATQNGVRPRQISCLLPEGLLILPSKNGKR